MSNDPISEIEAEAKAAGLSINDVLASAGVAQTTWWRWKQGKFDPRQATLRLIRDVIAKSRKAA